MWNCHSQAAGTLLCTTPSLARKAQAWILVLQGYVRPGCLHLTVDVRLSRAAAAATAAGGVRGVAEALLSGPHAAFWAAQASQVLPLLRKPL